MTGFVATRTLRQATRGFKWMGFEPEGWGSVNELGRQALRGLLEGRMRAHRELYLEEMASGGRVDRANGHYRRHLLTSMGDIELSVPRTRTASALPAVAAYARRQPDVDRLILSCFVLGLSTRKVGEALLTILGEQVSASTVSQVAKGLDQAVAAFHRRPLPDHYPVLLLDGVVLSRRTGTGALRRPVLVALGITTDGKKEVLDFTLAPAESQTAWEGFLNDLYRRGLRGRSLEMIVTDGGKGLLAALPLVYPQVAVGRCWAHKTRNILDKIRTADRENAKRDLHRISHAKNRRAAQRAAGRFVQRWKSTYPRAVACLRTDLEELLTFFRFQDPDQRKAARTTNAIERRFREVRRRTRPMGAFSDRTSLERILFAVFAYENRKEGTGTPFLLTQNT